MRLDSNASRSQGMRKNSTKKENLTPVKKTIHEKMDVPDNARAHTHTHTVTCKELSCFNRCEVDCWPLTASASKEVDADKSDITCFSTILRTINVTTPADTI